eukprot:Awhi_evm1s10388
MYAVCMSNKNGNPTSEERDICCGPHTACIPSFCALQSSFVSNRYVQTFQKTGCPRPTDLSSTWKSHSDDGVSDMHRICMKNRNKSATTTEKNQCCGEGKTCTPTCSLQLELASKYL